MTDESQEEEAGALVAAAASTTSVTSDPLFHNYTSISKKEEEEEKRSDEEEAMKNGTDRADNDTKTSLLWKSKGFTYEFAKSPVRYVAWILLVLRAVERGIWFGFVFINQGFLTGYYNPNWSPGFSSSKAEAFISATSALNNTLPFIVALVADLIVGDYWTILILLLVFFLPGVLIITLCAWPYLLGDTFNVGLLRVGMQILYTVGIGGVDTICDIFGAKQFHPVHHTQLLDAFFIWATVMAGVGGLTAELGYSMIANFKLTPAFGAMFVVLAAATAIFIFGTKRYIVRKRDRKANLATIGAAVESTFCLKRDKANNRFEACLPGFDKLKESKGGHIKDELVTAAFRLLLIVPIQGFFIPINLGFQQMTNVLIPMSFSMNHPKYWTGTNMVFVSSGHTVIFGVLANKFFYPYLENKKNIHLSTCNRMAIGSFLYVLMYLSMIGIDHRIRRVYEETGDKISIWWQYFPYALSGFAYLLTQPTQDSVTYRVSPNEWKVFGNAINKFMQAGISNFISMALYKRCASWFNPNNGNDTINGITNYTAASSWKFIYVLGAFPAFQTIFCLLPWVDRWYQKIEEYVHKNDESHNE